MLETVPMESVLLTIALVIVVWERISSATCASSSVTRFFNSSKFSYGFCIQSFYRNLGAPTTVFYN
jgi:hypothetical protein